MVRILLLRLAQMAVKVSWAETVDDAYRFISFVRLRLMVSRQMKMMRKRLWLLSSPMLV